MAGNSHEGVAGLTYKFNVIILGDVAVGKTSLLMRFADNEFTQEYRPSVAVDVKKKLIKNVDGGRNVDLAVWDTAGQERLAAITAAYFRKGDGVLLLFSLSDLQSFKNVKKWINSIETKTDTQKTIWMLIGNKCDMPQKKQPDDIDISMKARELAQAYAVEYVETSAVTGHMVVETFELLARKLLQLKLSAANEPSAIGLAMQEYQLFKQEREMRNELFEGIRKGQDNAKQGDSIELKATDTQQSKKKCCLS